MGGAGETRMKKNVSGTKKSAVAALHVRFEGHAARNPQKTAVVYENQQLTYLQLNEAANRLAAVLLEKGIQPEDIVAFHLNRSAMIPAAMLGILKAGAAFLPLDPQLPQNRLQQMLRDSKTRFLLTEQYLQPFWESSDIPRLILDDPQTLAGISGKENPSLPVQPNQLAYLMYTSGSTGKPRGVLLEHAGVLNAIDGHIKVMQLNQDEKILQFSSVAFDASVAEIFIALCNGGSVCMADRDTLLDPHKLTEFARRNWITVAILTPSMLKVLDTEVLSSVRHLLSVGEVCAPFVAERWMQGRRFYNGYGPTEASICASIFAVQDPVGEAVAIGKPLPGVTTLVLDEKQNLVKPGKIGELYIGGEGVARGYLNDSQLTKKKFVPVRLRPGQQERFYRSGDLVRQDSSGEMFFCGRVDHQVKIRGQRIEIQEIENAITAIGGVLNCTVIAKPDHQGQQQLLAYWMPANEIELSDKDLRECLEMMLPAAMIPARFMRLETLPMTNSGKIDLQALPEMPPVSAPDPLTGEEGAISSNDTSDRLKSLVVSVLGLNRVDEDDNFFQLGGNSLHITQLVARISTEFGVQCSLSSLFQKPTVTQLVELIDQQQQSDAGQPEFKPAARAMPGLYKRSD